MKYLQIIIMCLNRLSLIVLITHSPNKSWCAEAILFSFLLTVFSIAF